MSANWASAVVILITISTYRYLVVNRNIAFTTDQTTFLRQVYQNQVLRVNRNYVVERKGEGQVGLCVRMDYDVVEDSLSDISVIDRIDDLGKKLRY